MARLMDSLADRLQRKSDARAARWERRRQDRARRGKTDIGDRLGARMERKAAERQERWRNRPPRPPWPPRWYGRLGIGLLVLGVAAIAGGTTAWENHIQWLSDLMADVTGIALGGALAALIKSNQG